MSTEYRINGQFWTDLTDLLSEDYPEDTRVVVSPGFPAYDYDTTLARLRADYQAQTPAVFSKLRRVAARANEGYAERLPQGGVRYAVAMITEGQPGWSVGYWFSTLEEAQRTADIFNAAAGHTSEDALEIEISSMRAGRTR